MILPVICVIAGALLLRFLKTSSDVGRPKTFQFNSSMYIQGPSSLPPLALGYENIGESLFGKT